MRLIVILLLSVNLCINLLAGTTTTKTGSSLQCYMFSLNVQTASNTHTQRKEKLIENIPEPQENVKVTLITHKYVDVF